MIDSCDRKPFGVQMRSFFGFRAGEGAKEFVAELKALSHADKLEFAEMLNAAGFPCDPPAATQVAA
jgi:hypothetical protein